AESSVVRRIAGLWFRIHYSRFTKVALISPAQFIVYLTPKEVEMSPLFSTKPLAILQSPTIRPRIAVIIAIVGVIFLGSQQPAMAQESKTGHVHYMKTADADKPAPNGAVAPRLQNLGKHTFPVTTTNKDAQLFMNQGFNLSYAFNHAEAGRAFREAARLDPNLAMAYWGQALVLGPNINAPMDPNAEPTALELIKKAVSLKSKASPRERAYIDALVER